MTGIGRAEGCGRDEDRNSRAKKASAGLRVTPIDVTFSPPCPRCKERDTGRRGPAPFAAARKTAQKRPRTAMILSMTGFAAVAAELPGAALAVELRSVNHRYLDLVLRLPDEFRVLEPALRERIAAELKRGKVECRVAMARREGAGTLAVDPAARRRPGAQCRRDPPARARSGPADGRRDPPLARRARRDRPAPRDARRPGARAGRRGALRARRLARPRRRQARSTCCSRAARTSRRRSRASRRASRRSMPPTSRSSARGCAKPAPIPTRNA